MAGAQSIVEIEIDDREIRDGLQALEAKLGNLKPFFRDIGEALLNSTRERFNTQQAPDGSPWAALSPNIRKRENAHLVLTLNGYLRGTLSYQADKDSLRVGSPMDYAATHQFGAKKGAFGRTRRGSPIPWGDIPARPFLGLSDDDSQYILDAIQEWLSSSFS